jgi:molybdopterin-binding protein
VTLETASTDARTDEAVSVAVRSDDILLQRVQPGQSPALLSARNRLSGTLEQVIVHGREAEAVVCVGPTRWFVSIVASNVETLDLRPGVEVNLIIKARSCVVTRLNPTSGSESAAPG